jgi:adenine-specific DNA-methyltransferase
VRTHSAWHLLCVPPRRGVACWGVIKYLGSKRRLVPVLEAICEAAGARTALDLFTGTTRVAQAFKRAGAHVTAVDSARYSEVLARCYVEADARLVNSRALERALRRLNALPGREGYVSEVFCRDARFFHPRNGARIDAIRAAIHEEHAGSPLEPLLLTSLLEAADRVDSTTGVQMAYLKQWAPRALGDLELRAPELLPGAGRALRGDARAIAPRLDEVDLAYLDPPYNHHSYLGNYHVWETITASDEPEHYGVACKRDECRDTTARSAFNSKRTMPDALRALVAEVPARLLVLSYNDEAWLSLDELTTLCSVRGEVGVLAYDSKRYVGAQIGIHNPAGRRVGTPGRLRNTEYLLLAGERRLVQRALAAVGPVAQAA